MSVRFPAFPLLLALGAAELAAQEPSRLETSLAATPSRPALPFGPGIFRAPIHTQQADELLGEYGWWASGDTFKVSFEDGFAFYPWLGKSYPENLPLRWRTARITVAGEPIADLSAPEAAHTDWRYEYRHDGVTEAYDVLADGVEQSFVIARRPVWAGDLVVEGAIDTRLLCAAVEPRHQALVFTDANGNPIVRYGEAFAFDAAGRSTEVATSFDGSAVRLVVPSDWLASAAFPVTIDPLTNAYMISNDPGNSAENPSIHREDESPGLSTMVAYMRVFSGGDYDVFAGLGPANLQSTSVMFADVAATTSALLPDVSFVAGADRWIIGFWRHTGAEDRIRCYFHDKENLTLNSGYVASNHNPPGEHGSFPAVGGTSHPTIGTEGILVYRADPFYGNSATSEIRALRVNAAGRSFTSVSTIAAADSEAPDVNCQMGWGEDGWIIVYQSRSDALDDYDINARRLRASDYYLSGALLVGPDNLGDKVRPVVQGWDGRYVCAMLQDVTPEIYGQHYGRNVLTHRFNWATAPGTVTMSPYRTVSRSPNQDLTKLSLAYDGVSMSHWCLLHDSDVFTSPRTQVRRLGQTGAVTESTDLGTVRYQAAATWNGLANEFLIVSCGNESLSPIWGQLLQYSNGAWHMRYGPSCGPGVITSDTAPFPGSQFYRVILENAPPGQAAALLFSWGAGSIDLAPLGAANCFVNLAQFDVVIPTVTSGSGGSTHQFSLPDFPLFTGDLYWQFVYTWPAAPTPLQIGATSGLRASVR